MHTGLSISHLVDTFSKVKGKPLEVLLAVSMGFCGFWTMIESQCAAVCVSFADLWSYHAIAERMLVEMRPAIPPRFSRVSLRDW
jgi:hypothetical protein